MLRGIFVSGYNSKSGMAGCGSGSLNVALKLVDDHHFPPCQIQGEMMLNCKTVQYSRTSSDM